MKPIYLDYNASTPISAKIREVMLPYLGEFYGNPSSSHWYGTQLKKAVETARQQVADLIDADPDEIFFTSGGSESNNLAITGFAFANEQRGKHIITSAVEHPAVENVCRYLQSRGFRITTIPVDKYGRVDPQAVEDAIEPDTILITIMHANNEVGTIQPIAKIAKIAHRHDITLHTDAAQSAGKIPVLVHELGADLLSIAGHKVYAPKGVGALYIRRGTKLQKLIHGADHERDMRAGTENVLEIVGLGSACAEAKESLVETSQHLQTCAERLWKKLNEHLDNIKWNGHPEFRLPNTVNVSFQGIEANTLLAELDGIAASAGAACHSDDITISAVLQAMQIPMDWAMGTVRFSVGKMTTFDEIDKAAEMIISAVQRLSGSGLESESIPDDTRLTRFTHGLGCACKLRPQALEEILRELPVPQHPNILVGTDTADDAAVYKINDQTAIVQTVDFFTPIVDDPYDFGAITAANAFSDIYAMGGTPQFALNIVAFPSNRLPMSVLQSILQGAYDKAKEAGVVIVGGHTIDDTEPKYGLAVTGFIHPQSIWKNVGAQDGDALVLTKSLGTGILSTAMKQQALSSEHSRVLVNSMSTLNKSATELANEFDIHACTDITGFGLLGHLHEMLNEGNMNAILIPEAIPVLPGTEEMLNQQYIPGGTKANLSYAESFTHFNESVRNNLRLVLADAQTSGGLLFAMPPKQAKEFIHQFNKTENNAYLIGHIKPGNGDIIVQ